MPAEQYIRLGYHLNNREYTTVSDCLVMKTARGHNTDHENNTMDCCIYRRINMAIQINCMKRRGQVLNCKFFLCYAHIMARPLRIQYPGAVYHLTSRGNARNNIFLDDADRQAFLKVLESVIVKYNWLCHGYCLMDNHYHLLIETTDPNLSLGIRQLNGVYTQRFNHLHNRVGHVFQGRYK